MDLLELLEKYSASGVYPMHMPGHKRNRAFLPLAEPTLLDITEIDGFDNLHSAEGVLADAMARAAALWGAKRSFFVVNGSSAGILAALSAALPVGGELCIDRSAHKSAYHAIELRQLTPHYLSRPLEPATGVLGSLSPDEVSRALEANPNAQAVFVTSPTYEGVVSDIASLAKVAHARGCLLIVDEAHGAHLGFSPDFPRSAVTEGADIVIQSLHKTLPAFTQSAILHICSDRVDEARVAKFLSYYQTTSPSYLLMAGIDRCVSLLSAHADALFEAYSAKLASFRAKMEGLAHIKLLGGASSAIFAHDPGKLYFSLVGTGLTGVAFGKRLREDYAIEPEMVTADGCLCMTSIADSGEGFDRLASALLEIDRGLTSSKGEPCSALSAIPLMRCTPAEAAEMRAQRLVPLTEAVGCAAGEFVWAYPPDIPLLVPGEVVDASLIAHFRRLQASGVRLHSDTGALDSARGGDGMLKILV